MTAIGIIGLGVIGGNLAVLGALARLDHVVPASPGRICEHVGLSTEKVGEEPHIVGVVGYNEEIQRA